MNYNNPSSTSNANKRDFLKYVLGGSLLAWAAAVLYPILAYLKPPRHGEVEVTTIKVGKLAEISKDSAMIVRFGNKPVLLIRLPDGECRAFGGTCTHLDCTVQYRQDIGSIWCACHNGKYDLSGRNIAGPPPRPLDVFRVIIQGEDVFISKAI